MRSVHRRVSGELCGQVAAPVPDPGVPAAWAILVIVVLVALFEVWALWRGKNTISHLIQRLSRSRRWFRWLVGLGLAVLGWHLLFGFPW